MKIDNDEIGAGERCGALVAKVIAKRRSVRRFADTKLDEGEIECILRAGINAPSGSNWQNQRFLVLTDADEIERVGKIRFVWPYKNSDPARVREKHPAGILGHGAALILVFADAFENDRRGNGEHHLWEALEGQNCAASIQNMLVQATALGIGSCWVSASEGMSYTRLLSGKSWRQALSNYEIPSTYKIQGMIVLGHPIKTDDEQFPRGEAKHGATIWQSVERGPTSDYLVNKEVHPPNPEGDLSTLQMIRLRLLQQSIRQLLGCVRFVDRRIHRLENR